MSTSKALNFLYEAKVLRENPAGDEEGILYIELWSCENILNHIILMRFWNIRVKKYYA